MRASWWWRVSCVIAAYLPVSQPFREGHWLVQPLPWCTVSELHRFMLGWDAAHRKLPAPEDHRQGKLCQGQTGTTHPDWSRGRFNEASGCWQMLNNQFEVIGGKKSLYYDTLNSAEGQINSDIVLLRGSHFLQLIFRQLCCADSDHWVLIIWCSIITMIKSLFCCCVMLYAWPVETNHTHFFGVKFMYILLFLSFLFSRLQ